MTVGSPVRYYGMSTLVPKPGNKMLTARCSSTISELAVRDVPGELIVEPMVFVINILLRLSLATNARDSLGLCTTTLFHTQIAAIPGLVEP